MKTDRQAFKVRDGAARNRFEPSGQMQHIRSKHSVVNLQHNVWFESVIDVESIRIFNIPSSTFAMWEFFNPMG